MEVSGYYFSLRMLNRNPDDRVLTVKGMYKEGNIKCISDIYRFFKPTPLSKKAGITFKRFFDCKDNVEEFTMRELLRIARLFDWTVDQMLDLWKAEYQVQEEKKASKIKKLQRS